MCIFGCLCYDALCCRSGLNIISSHRILEIVESIRLQHYALCDIAALLNSAYGTQILFTALQVFVTLLSSIFYCIRMVGLRPETLELNPTVLVVYTINVVFLSFAQLWGCVVYASNANFEVIFRQDFKKCKKIKFEEFFSG